MEIHTHTHTETCDLAQMGSLQMVALLMTVVHSYALTQCLERGSHLTDASTFLINWYREVKETAWCLIIHFIIGSLGYRWSLIKALGSWCTVLPLCTELTSVS